MEDCCNNKCEELKNLRQHHRLPLQIVLAINLILFFIEIIAGIQAHSTSLMADSLDMLGDTLVYGVSLYALGRGRKLEAQISFGKGLFMGTFALVVLVQGLYRFFVPAMPIAFTMGMVGILALLGNLACAAILLRYRNEGINMRSTWLCSRNDVISNIAILVAAYLVNVTDSRYPDLIVALFITILVLKSSVSILIEAKKDFRTVNH